MSDPRSELWVAMDDVEVYVRAVRRLLRDDPQGEGLVQALREMRETVDGAVATAGRLGGAASWHVALTRRGGVSW